MNESHGFLIACPKCQKPYRLKPDLAGKRVRCANPACGSVFEVPVPAKKMVPGTVAVSPVSAKGEPPLDLAAQLLKLHQLRECGALSAEEFTQAKQACLLRMMPTSPPPTPKEEFVTAEAVEEEIVQTQAVTHERNGKEKPQQMPPPLPNAPQEEFVPNDAVQEGKKKPRQNRAADVNDGGVVVATKVVNALIAQAEMGFATKFILDMSGAKGTGVLLGAAKKMMGGLWVGGRVSVYQRQLVFRPNWFNSLVHRGNYTVTIPLVEVSEVNVRFGVLTKIIDITTRHGILSIRGFGAPAFADLIRKQVAIARSSEAGEEEEIVQTQAVTHERNRQEKPQQMPPPLPNVPQEEFVPNEAAEQEIVPTQAVTPERKGKKKPRQNRAADNVKYFIVIGMALPLGVLAAASPNILVKVVCTAGVAILVGVLPAIWSKK